MDRGVAEQTRELNRKMRCGARSVAVALLAAVLFGCDGTPESRLRKALASRATGTIHLPGGLIEVSSELQLARGAHDLEIIGAGTVLKASDTFQGRAIVVAEESRRIRFRNFSIDGNRTVLEKPLDLAVGPAPFRASYSANGMWFDRVDGLEISNLHLDRIANFAILISRSSGIAIRQVEVRESGSRNLRGRNNTTGGVLLEEGASNFEVTGCTFENILGNALWTHSFSKSPRAENGLFAGNHFDLIGRDAIQVGHATGVRVEDNIGIRIGFPAEAVDVENQGTPVAIDTSGNVDQSAYARNSFEEINGKCIDLDGFHDGAVRDNLCANHGAAEDYPAGQFGIVINDTNPEMQPVNIEISGNRIRGTKFGGLFLMGSKNRVTGNTFENLDTAGCNENAARFGCLYKKSEPELLQSGIYLARGGSRPVEARGNVIRNNRISGYRMRARCIAAAPGVSLAANVVEGNACADAP